MEPMSIYTSPSLTPHPEMEWQELFDSILSLMLPSGVQPKELRQYDVFLSYTKPDTPMINSIKEKIEGWGYTVFDYQKDNPAPAGVTPETVDQVRRDLRRCSCLIFAYSAQATLSKWMPWELGFFDGRHDASRIGILPLGEDAEHQFVGQEYLNLKIYRKLTIDELEAFLDNARRERRIEANQAFFDQFGKWIEGLSNNPVDFELSLVQYYFGVLENFAVIRREKLQLLDPAEPFYRSMKLWLDGLRGEVSSHHIQQSMREAGKVLEAKGAASLGELVRHYAEYSAPAIAATGILGAVPTVWLPRLAGTGG